MVDVVLHCICRRCNFFSEEFIPCENHVIIMIIIKEVLIKVYGTEMDRRVYLPQF